MDSRRPSGPNRNRRRLAWRAAAMALVAVAALADPANAPWAREPVERARERDRMVDEIDALMQAAAADTGRPHPGPCVRQAMREVPRHRFVPDDLQALAYANRALPIGAGQTISQPVVVALMTELLDVGPADRVLEIGTGSGYQAAVLSRCARAVYTIEIVRALGEQAAARLAALGYRNVETRIGDGYRGWPQAAPFDRIIVTAAPDRVPPALLDQLKPGGRMVVPVGAAGQEQSLTVIRKAPDGTITSQAPIAVRFVPMTGGPGGSTP